MEGAEVKQLVDEIKAELTQGVVEEALKRIDEKLEKLNALTGGNAKDVVEEKKKAAEYIKAKFIGDEAKAKVLGAGTTGEGAELVPTVLSSEIIRIAQQYGLVRRLARRYPLTSLKEEMPTAEGVVAYRKNENTAVTPSSVNTDIAASFDVEEVMALVPFSNKLLQNPTYKIVDIISVLAGEAFAKLEDTWGLGDILNSTSVSEVVLSTGNTTYDSVSFDDLLEALNRLDENALNSPNLRWVMSFSVFNALRKKKDANNRYILQEPSQGQPATLWNIPVEFSTVMPKTTETNQAGKRFIILGDFRYLLFGEKEGMSMDISREASIDIGGTTYRLFQNNMSAVRFTAYEDLVLTMPDKAFVAVKTAAA